MDDDLTFGVSVWATPSDPAPPAKLGTDPVNAFAAADSDEEGLDDFDDFADFGAPVPASSAEMGDDDFGDFGESHGEVVEGFGDDIFAEEERQNAGPSHATWEPLRLDPLPSRAELEKQLNGLLGSIFGNEDISEVTTDEEMREMEGIGQILTTPGR